MPRLWNETVEEHRREVGDAILNATSELVAEQGLHAVTMSRIATKAGIGRATLYKYFPDIEAILFAWHERQVSDHLQHLAKIGHGAGTPAERLEAVLREFAQISHQRHGAEIATLLHRGEHVAQAQQHLTGFLGHLIAEGVRNGEFRDDVAPDELANFCLHSLTAAAGLSSQDALRRLVTVTLAGLRPD
ncbi:TetR/AcrR family transcriptional regulator [Saccharopolyspora sp. NPDC049357]|uniref:TetR/AcrR family transcriptional regulator n=1 Tax=Saccharopolyspora sp. NPDC049357 TaxID=3154507 RepID=UPI00341D1A4D